METYQQMLMLILLGIGGGMIYGRWRAEWIRARAAMKKTWDTKRDGRGPKTWKAW